MKWIHPFYRLNLLIQTVLILISTACISLLYGLSYLDDINMMNNGFVNQEAITFIIPDEEPSFKQIKEPFILFQQDTRLPEKKWVWVNGNIRLPIENSTYRSYLNAGKNIVVNGLQHRLGPLPAEYIYAGHFQETNSYKLQREIWFIPAAYKVDMTNGNLFTFVTFKEHGQRFREMINDSSVKIIDKELLGTYSMSSNSIMIKGLQASLGFLVLAFIAVHMFWAMKQKMMIQILHLHGHTSWMIWKRVMMKEAIISFVFSMLLLIMANVVQLQIFPLWNQSWLSDATMWLWVANLYIWSSGGVFVYRYVRMRGGKS
ncbi:hypothetical protein [Marinicrinis sediminis]|uniref:MacB-like periplasmic core domain-containing protein n=1 Tax=Marinicrinis sediminis TaxID=1652465 RepID=A0ABW5RBM1_9BACL